MKSRKAAAIEAGEEQQAKRRKIGNQNNKAESLMDSLNNDCLVSILSNLSVGDLNTVAMCNRRFRDARTSDSLDQTRTGTVILSEGSTTLSLFNAIVENNWKNVFSGNRKKLKLVGVEHLSRGSPSVPAELVESAQISGVTALDASLSIVTNDPALGAGLGVSKIFCIFPNLKELDTSYTWLRSGTNTAMRKHCPAITRITWKSRGSNPQPHCGERFQGLNHLKELCLDGFRFFRYYNELNRYLFVGCPSIERLSIKGCSFDGVRVEGEGKLPQEDIIRMVRSHPSLRWLRSNLSVENVAMLQQQRPEITFVSE